jgi:threonine dehydrogenase-like Zn-dependent dehydrogenase
VCGSDRWPYRGVETLAGPQPMGHEYAGIVEEVGPDVRTVKPGRFVVGSFWATDNTCAMIDRIWRREIDPGQVFDLALALDDAADAYRAMDQREAIKVLLRP